MRKAYNRRPNENRGQEPEEAREAGAVPECGRAEGGEEGRPEEAQREEGVREGGKGRPHVAGVRAPREREGNPPDARPP